MSNETRKKEAYFNSGTRFYYPELCAALEKGENVSMLIADTIEGLPITARFTAEVSDRDNADWRTWDAETLSQYEAEGEGEGLHEPTLVIEIGEFINANIRLQMDLTAANDLYEFLDAWLKAKGAQK
ncbi:MAG: hypothetical protein LBO72_07325 [Helicobacteraceae bacterium]|jgi:hypothetical protein|nr:hypothetical protein [Helicobacteraceae bacterium]